MLDSTLTSNHKSDCDNTLHFDPHKLYISGKVLENADQLGW